MVGFSMVAADFIQQKSDFLNGCLPAVNFHGYIVATLGSAAYHWGSFYNAASRIKIGQTALELGHPISGFSYACHVV